MPQINKAKAWLEFQNPKDGSSTRVDLVEDTFSIGRKGANLQVDFQTVDPAASHIHAIISREQDSFVLRDLSSKNGTIVNEKPIIEHKLTNGDRIRIGQSKFVFKQDRKIEVQEDTELYLHPFLAFSNAQKFWTEAVQTPIFSIQKTWLFHFSNIFFLFFESYSNGRAAPVAHLCALLGSFVAALFLMSVFTKLYLKITLLAALRVIYFCSPVLTAIQTLFLVTLGLLSASTLTTLIASVLPGIAIFLFLRSQIRTIFMLTKKKLFAFCFLNWILWNAFMTFVVAFAR